jgi:hypothetical protein
MLSPVACGWEHAVSDAVVILTVFLVKGMAIGGEGKPRVNSNAYVEIMNYETSFCAQAISNSDFICIKVLYKARKRIDGSYAEPLNHKLIIDCFDNNGKQLAGTSHPIADYNASLSPGEVRTAELYCPPKTTTFHVRIYSSYTSSMSKLAQNTDTCYQTALSNEPPHVPGSCLVWHICRMNPLLSFPAARRPMSGASLSQALHRGVLSKPRQHRY